MPRKFPPKNIAVIANNEAKYSAPVSQHTSIRLRLIFTDDVSVPKMAENNKIPTEIYPTTFSSTFPFDTIHANIAAKINVIDRLTHKPIVTPAGIDTAVPFVFFVFIILIPSPTNLWRLRNKKNRSSNVLLRFDYILVTLNRHLCNHSIKQFGCGSLILTHCGVVELHLRFCAGGASNHTAQISQ